MSFQPINDDARSNPVRPSEPPSGHRGHQTPVRTLTPEQARSLLEFALEEDANTDGGPSGYEPPGSRDGM